ncbi:MAG: magnesium transporter [Clostridia bacterium]|nr:magnesium transporter [Clostridia bacterium]
MGNEKENELKEEEINKEAETAQEEKTEVQEEIKEETEEENKEEEEEEEFPSEQNYVDEIIELIRSDLPDKELVEELGNYHENDIAGAFEQLEPEERKRLYDILGAETFSEIFAYVENVEQYIEEMGVSTAAKVLENMDSDDAVDILDEIDDETEKKIVSLMDEESSQDIQLIRSYDDDEIGSKMTTNFILIKNDLTIKQAMSSLIEQAGDNDNISTIYVEDEDERFYGALELKDLIRARYQDKLEPLISTSYPYVRDHEHIADCLERLREYTEDSFPVLSEEGKVLGIITAQDIVEVVDEEMGEDYAKLAGLTAEEDLNEPIKASIKKRIPWLITLLFLGLVVSSAIGIFEDKVVALLPIIAVFQSMVFDMAGNTGTQSLAVTIRVLMDESVSGRQKAKLVFKEVRVGMCNGLILGITAFVVVGLYILAFKRPETLNMPLAQYAFTISGCIAFSLFSAMIIASLVGTTIPMFLHKIHIDPAVASGPMITTVNDLIATMVYYGLALLLLINVFHMGVRVPV